MDIITQKKAWLQSGLSIKYPVVEYGEKKERYPLIIHSINGHYVQNIGFFYPPLNGHHMAMAQNLVPL